MAVKVVIDQEPNRSHRNAGQTSVTLVGENGQIVMAQSYDSYAEATNAAQKLNEALGLTHEFQAVCLFNDGSGVTLGPVRALDAVAALRLFAADTKLTSTPKAMASIRICLVGSKCS